MCGIIYKYSTTLYDHRWFGVNCKVGSRPRFFLSDLTKNHSDIIKTPVKDQAMPKKYTTLSSRSNRSSSNGKGGSYKSNTGKRVPKEFQSKTCALRPENDPNIKVIIIPAKGRRKR